MVNVSGGQIELKVLVDIKEVQGKLKVVKTELKEVENAANNAGKGTQKAGDQAAASAVKFQTLTQGAINLTTAFIQTETTISNLRRAKTSLKAAMVGVERANDLLIRKQAMLTDEYKKAAPDMTKIKLLTNEIATAEDDLIVKQDRIIDQREQLKDTYKLFALNLLNVSFSAVQTGVSMVQMAKGIKAATIATKLMQVATSKYTLIALAVIAAWEMGAQAIKVFNKELGDQVSIISNVNKMMNELGMVTDTNLENYETSMHKATESTLEFENGWKGMTNTVKKETDAQIAIVKHWEKEIKIHNIKVAEGLAESGFRLAEQRNQNFQTGSETALPKGVKGAGAYATLGAGTVAPFWAALVNLTHNLFPNIPEAQAEEMLTKNQTGQLKAKSYNPTIINQQGVASYNYAKQNFMFSGYSRTNAKRDPFNLLGETGGNGGNTALDILGGRTPNQVAEGLTVNQAVAMNLHNSRLSELNNERVILENRISRMEQQRESGVFISGDVMATEKIRLVELLFELDELENLKHQEEEQRKLYQYGSLRGGGYPTPQAFPASSPEMSASRVRHRLAKYGGGNKISDFLYKGETLVGGAFEYKSGGWQLKKPKGRRVYYAGNGGLALAHYQLNTSAGFGQNSHVMRSLEYAQILAQEQFGVKVPVGHKTMVNFRTVAGVDATLSPMEQARMGMAILNRTLNDPSGLGPNPYGNFANRRFSADYTPNFAGSGRVTGPMWRRAQIAVEDRNRNRMKTGGRRVLNEDGSPMYDLWDDRAVEGGFTSISAYRDDWWTKFRAKGRQAESFAQMLGNETKSAATYNTASSLIGSMNSTMGLLGRTGLSLSSLPSRGDFMPRRAGGGIGNVGNRYFSIMASINRAHQAAISRTIATNQLTLKRAGQIDLLIGGFGLDSYYGSGLGLQQLQLAVQKQDELIQSIGLNRTEAFRIIDTQGRGRNEIEDRVRWTQRNESISTGNIVL